MASGIERDGATFSLATAAEMDYEGADSYLHHQDGPEVTFELEKDDGHERHGFLLQTLAVVLGSLILIVIAMTGLQNPAGHSTLFTMGSEKYVGIDLHPEDHVDRPPTTIVQNWTITSDYRWPDGVKKMVYLVNGQFPGPTVECRQGDKLIIHVTNALAAGEKSATFNESYALARATEGISIHWHGLQMRGSNHMDGAVGVTQCPIPAGESFTYEFDVGDQAGTFWWHAHSAVYRGDGLFGGLIIHKAVEGNGKAGKVTDLNEYGYEKEVLLMVGDWYHKTAEDVLAWYTRYVGLVDEVSLLFSPSYAEY